MSTDEWQKADDVAQRFVAEYLGKHDSPEPATEETPNTGEWLETPDGKHAVQLIWEVTNGVANLVGVVIVRTDDQVLRPTGIRAFRWREIVDEDRAAYRAQGRMTTQRKEIPDGTSWQSTTGATWSAHGNGLELGIPAEVPTDGRRVWPDSHYQEIAELHRESHSASVGRADSHNYIREQYNKRYPDRKPAKKTTVKNWVHAARKKGLL